MRCCHGRAVEEIVCLTRLCWRRIRRNGGKDVSARRVQVHAGRTPARAPPARVVTRGVVLHHRSYGYDIVTVVARWVVRVNVGVVSAVAGGARHDGVRRFDGVLKRLVVAASAPAAAYDLRALVGRVVESQNSIGGVSSVGAEELENHDLDIPVDAGDTHGVVRESADGTGRVRSVLVIEVSIAVTFTRIPYGIVAIEPVPSPDVIDVPVSVVIDAVAGDFIRVDPDIWRKVRMVDIAACVYDGH